MGTRRACQLAAVLLGMGIAVASRLRVSHVGRTMRVPGTLHYGAHVALFAVLTALCLKSTKTHKVGWLLFFAVLLLGYGTEFYEHLKDTYPIEFSDVFSDTLGACLAMLRWLRWRGRLSLAQPRQRHTECPLQ